MQTEVNRIIDRCSSNITAYDISIIVHRVFKDKYRYKGKSNWEYLDESGVWLQDKSSTKLRNDIKSNISNLFLQRYLYWYDQCVNNGGTDINENIQSHMMANKMLKISLKLKTNNFISTVIKEAKAFFDIYNENDGNQ